MSDMLRITGLSSGMDTDTTVKKLIQLEQIKVDRVKQEKQFMEWQKEDYREIGNIMRGFNDEYFDILKPETNMRSASTFNMYSSEITVGGEASTAVSINTSSLSLNENFSIDSIAKLATNDSYVSSSEVFGNIKSFSTINTIDSINALIGVNDKLEFTFDGAKETIQLDGGYADYSELTADLSAKMQAAFENVDITVTESGGLLDFQVYKKGTGDVTGDGSHVVELGHTLEVGGENPSILNSFKIAEGQSTSLNPEMNLYDLFGREGASSMTINGVAFSFDRDVTITEMVAEINSSTAGVTMSYDNFSDKFTLASTTAGTNNAISFTDTDGLLADLKIDAGAHVGATNAEFVVNGVLTTRASNTFEINGTSVTLNETSTDPVDIEVKQDTTDVKDMIVKFVSKYNEMIAKINTMTSTRKNRDYAPLTDEQKKPMSEDDIKAWEIQARKGTLHNDLSLDSITRDLRNSIYETIEGVGISMYDIGISASANYKEQGKLIIDETKLDAALKDRPNEVIELFTKQSEEDYMDNSVRQTRDGQNGIAYRIYDILQDNIRIIRDDNGRKGSLIEKAGFGTVDTTSDMAKRLLEMDDKIDDLLKLLGDKETKYYQQFSAMETAMARLQAQGSALTSQLGG